MNNLKISIFPIAFFAIFIAGFSLTIQAEMLNVQSGISLYPDPRLEGNTYIEFPFAVPRNQFSFLAEEDSAGPGLLAAIYAELILYDTLDNPVDSSRTYFLTRARDSSEAGQKDIRLFNRLSLMVPPGIYSARLTVLDAIGKNEGSFLYDRIVVDSVIDDRLNLSSLEFAYNISVVEDSSEEAGGRLVKNGREIIPNPMGIYSEADSNIFIYAELYNLEFEGNTSDSLNLNYRILNSDNVVYHDYGDLVISKPGSSSVVCNVLDISDLKPGRYELSLIATEFSTGMSDSASGRFILFPSSGELADVVTYTKKHPMDTASLQTRMNLVHYILAPQQLAMLESLNDTGKVRFIDQFFADHDPDLETEENEYLDDIFRRYIYANENFSNLPGANDGWKTDRGRVLLQYGVWDEREDIPAPSYGRPYEVWSYYSLQGGVVFVFQDIDGYGDSRLVHSDARGEIYNSDWENLVKDIEPTMLK
ncbi:MAG: GWxTD domain-containing protein [Candidatus Zixiibacteriota bacterium]|nr:MAG: GWxTD domain-containing protein [candidate division Zixibacteria bacterium]